MNKLTISIYRKPKWEWYDFVGFSGARIGSEPYIGTYGWSKTGYAEASGINRSTGARIMRGDTVVETGIAFSDLSINGQYLQFNSLTQSGDKVQIKYDPREIIRFWYRYAGINQILFDLNQCRRLTEISLRKNNIDFGDMDLSNLDKLQVFEISANQSINSLILNPNAPIIRYYVSSTWMSQQTMDYIILHAYNRGLTGGTIGNSVMPSDSVCDECDVLINQRGWAITNYPVCETVNPNLSWRGIDPICEIVNEPPVIGQLRLVDSDSFTVELEWDPATDDKGIETYEIWAYNYDWGGYMLILTVSGNTLTATFDELSMGTYTFIIRAKDTDGAYSDNSNTVEKTVGLVDPGPDPEPTSDLTLYDFKVGDWRFYDQGAMSNSSRTYDEYSIPTDGYWSITNKGLRIDYEDGVTCGGSNNRTYQSAACDNEFTITQAHTLNYSINGVVPSGGNGYVGYSMMVGPHEHYHTFWGESNISECQTQSFNHVLAEVTLQPGTYRIYILSDSDYHTNNNGTYLNFEYTLTPI